MSSRIHPLIVVPTYQEADNIGILLTRLRQKASFAEVLVVDDGSPDGTADIADEAGARTGAIHVLRRPAKAGLCSACCAGFEWARDRGFDVAIEMDADLSHDPGDVPRLLTAIREGADLAIGSRYCPGGSVADWSAVRRLLSNAGNRYAGAMLRLGVRDATSGFRAWRLDLLDAIDLRSLTTTGYGFLVEMTYRATHLGADITEVPIAFTDRRHGHSKMSPAIAIETLRQVTRWGISDRLALGGASLPQLEPGPAH